jgi:hypothetical protein
LLVGSVEATTNDFVVQPKQEVTVSSPTLSSPTLTSRDRVFGNISVQDGFVDFYISSPTGRIVLCDKHTAFADFDFTAEEAGNYTFHFINSLLTQNVTVILDYIVQFVFTIGDTSKTDVSVATATLSQLTPISPQQPDKPESENSYEKYLNFQQAETISRTIGDVLEGMPLGLTLAIIGICSLTVLGVSFLWRIYRKPIIWRFGKLRKRRRTWRLS